MSLHLYQVDAMVPRLPDLLAHIVERHFDFYLRDSFRILTPNEECRQDLEALLLQDPRLEGVLIGKSLATLRSFAQSLLWQHPSPLPLAPLALQRKALEAALAKSFPQLNLDIVGLNRALKELLRLEDLDRLVHSMTNKASWKSLAVDFREILKNYGAWSPAQVLGEAWKALQQERIPELQAVEEIYFLGFHFPERALLDLLEVLLKIYPDLQVHLFLPPFEQLRDSAGLLDPLLTQLESWAKSETTRWRNPPPTLRQWAYATPLHECMNTLARLEASPQDSQILAPSSGNTRKLLEETLRRSFPDQTYPSRLSPLDSTLLFRLGPQFLVEGQESPVSFTDFLSQVVPLLLTLRTEAAQCRDAEGLRYLEAAFLRLQEWNLAESRHPVLRATAEWWKLFWQDWTESGSLSGGLSSRGLPLRSTDRAGLRSSRQVYLVGLNEGVYPPADLPYLLVEDFQDPLLAHEKTLALKQAIFSAKEEAILSFSEFSLSGRAMQASAAMDGLQEHLLADPIRNLPLEISHRHPYFEENLRRERFRLETLSSNEDCGNLQSLPVQELLREKVLGRPLSASYLDDYAKCPWRFFARWHLRLEEKYLEDLELEPMSRGQFQHRLLERTLRDFLDEDFSRGRFPSWEALETSLRKHFTELSKTLMQDERLKSFPPPVLADQLQRIYRQGLDLLKKEHEDWSEAPLKLLPARFEWGFGKKDQAAVSFNLPDGSAIPLSGAIDRIDVSADGNFYLIIDYKASGTEELSRQLREQKSFQLYLYLKATRQALFPEKKALGALYWDLKANKKNQGLTLKEEFQPFTKQKLRSHSFVTEGLFAESFDGLEKALEASLLRILDGDYSLDPPDCLGDRCEFSEICRYENKPK